MARDGGKASTGGEFLNILTYDGSQTENIRQAAVHGFIWRVF